MALRKICSIVVWNKAKIALTRHNAAKEWAESADLPIYWAPYSEVGAHALQSMDIRRLLKPAQRKETSGTPWPMQRLRQDITAVLSLTQSCA